MRRRHAHAQFVDLVDGTGATILDTRKTTPGLRALEKYAVRCGGGSNHRAGLDDAILVKENHLRLAGGISAALAVLAQRNGALPVEVEAETLDEVQEALAAGAKRILLDNMSPDETAAPSRSSPGARSSSPPADLGRNRPRVRRDRRRLHLGRRAHQPRPFAPRLFGGAMTALDVASLHDEIRELAVSTTP